MAQLPLEGALVTVGLTEVGARPASLQEASEEQAEAPGSQSKVGAADGRCTRGHS